MVTGEIEKMMYYTLGNTPGGGGTLGISGWECAAGTLEPLTYHEEPQAAKFLSRNLFS